MDFINTNICALATPQGSGAIAIIRLSGNDVPAVIEKIFHPASKKEAEPYKMRFGAIKDGDRLIDECLVVTFKAPNSYTGENSAEIYCHGSSYIIQQIIMLLMKYGVKMAEPGEFSKRAFLNGKMDLAQAEAVADLISSETSAAHSVALQQMKGGFSNELRQMRESLLNLVSLMELELDFSEEDVEFADRSELKSLLDEVTAKIASLIESFTLGNVIKNGVPVAIIGATNTGKSTLLNTILGEERAIVSNIHGTTRDVIEDTINLGGITFRFIDTAGIRETKETIEIIGIERTYKKLKQASIVIMVLDATRPEYFESSLVNLSNRLNNNSQKLVILLNKVDKIDNPDSLDQANELGELSEQSDQIVQSDQRVQVDQRDKSELRELNLSYSKDSFTSFIYSSQNVQQQIRQIERICSSGSQSYSVNNSVANDGTLSLENTPADKCLPGNGIASSDPLLNPIAIIPISAKQKLGIEQLKELLINTQSNTKIDGANSTLVTNVRHYQALMDAQIALYRVEDGLNDLTPTDLVAQDIREALYHLGSIVGEINTEEVLGNIFGRFCIGK